MLIGCPRERERAAQSEVQYFIGELLEDDELKVYRTHIVGLITCKTSLDPLEVVRSLKEMALANAYQFRFAIRFTPLEICVPSNIEDIAEAAEELIPKIGEDETFRVTVRRRHTDIETNDIIGAVAPLVKREVDLDNPDKTIWIEIVGELTGISVLNEEEEILSIMSMRDDMY